ncbi:MAG: hypothetical protein AAB323_01000 [Pseudomonadota bacterium]
MIPRVKHTAHVMLINNYYDTPMVYLIQEKNKNWGIFGGGQELHDQKSLVRTAARELEEETLFSLTAQTPMFRFLDTYALKDNNGGMHKTFITINSKISAKHILLDQPGNCMAKSYGDILRGQYIPLYLLLANIYKRQYSIFYNGEQINLRYFFAEAVRRNQDYLYTIFNKKYIVHTENRNNDLDLHAVTLSASQSQTKQPVIKAPRSELITPYNTKSRAPYVPPTTERATTPRFIQRPASPHQQHASHPPMEKAPMRYPSAPYNALSPMDLDFDGFETE